MDWKARGYLFRLYRNDHAPLHVHVFKDGRELGRYDLENGRFMDKTPRRKGAILNAMREVGLI